MAKILEGKFSTDDSYSCLKRQQLPSLLPSTVRIFWVIMPRRLRNWSYKDVTNFLREHGYTFFKELKGSHQAWIKRGSDGEKDTILEINFTHRPYPQGTLKTFVKKSRIDKTEWFKWGESTI